MKKMSEKKYSVGLLSAAAASLLIGGFSLTASAATTYAMKFVAALGGHYE